jgi:phenylalanyl-tRNA synthetase alpha chain
MTDFSYHFTSAKTITDCLEIRGQLFDTELTTIKTAIQIAPVEEKKILGAQLNEIRSAIQFSCDTAIQTIQLELEKDDFNTYDPTFYSPSAQAVIPGQLHPITKTINEIYSIFSQLGFDVFEGKHVLDQWTNFTSVNTPDYHPSREMQDTFFLNVTDEKGENYVMKTQATSNFSVYAKTHQPPFKAIFPSLTFRNETIDSTHDVNFHQFDLWMVDKNMNVSQLLTLMQHFFTHFFEGRIVKIRQRPSYFPFVQPGFETDISVEGYKGGKWVEVCGSGIIHEQVLKNVGIDPTVYSGIAWGFGIDRLYMIKHGIESISQLYGGNLEFLKAR